jgi:zinc transporter 1/2/3
VLSIHSIIVGTSMGIQSTIKDFIPIIISVVAHKWTEALALGISILKSDFSVRRLIIFLGIYASMEPIGIIIGSIVYEVADGKLFEYIEAILFAASAGTFIYIGVVDIMMEEFGEANGTEKLNLIKFVFLVTGFAVMTTLTLTTQNFL